MGFRTTEARHARIKDAAWRAGVTAQQYIEEAVEARLREADSQPALTPRERELLDRVLAALRDGDVELRDMMVRAILLASRDLISEPPAKIVKFRTKKEGL